MNVKKYLLIVGAVTMIFIVFMMGIIVVDSIPNLIEFIPGFDAPIFDAANMPDGSHDDKVEGLEVAEKSQAYNILVLGVDVEAKLTDVMMLCQIDPVDKEVKMLSIPRDTRVKVNSSTMKINSSFSHGGVEQVIKSVKGVTGLPVHHYVLINTAAFRDTIDALGGVDFNVPQDMDYEDPLQDLYIHLKKGYQHLDGDKAEQLVRFRRYPNGDIDRIKVQQEFLGALIDQKLSAAYILKIPEVYSIVEKNVATDMTPKEMINTGKQLLSVNRENFKSYTIPGEGRYVGEISYYIPFTEQLKELLETEF